jgi:hypothetical protein
MADPMPRSHSPPHRGSNESMTFYRFYNVWLDK